MNTVGAEIELFYHGHWFPATIVWAHDVQEETYLVVRVRVLVDGVTHVLTERGMLSTSARLRPPVLGAPRLSVSQRAASMLLHAAHSGSYNLALRMIELGGLEHVVQDAEGFTPLFAAVRRGDTALVGAILVGAGGRRTRAHPLGRVAWVDDRHQSGWTPLMFAANADFAGVARQLLDAGADPDATDDEAWSALMLASQAGHTSCVTALLAAGATVDLQGPEGWTPLMLACKEGHTKCVRTLLRSGRADVHRSIEGLHGRTALMQAARRGFTSVLELLLGAGARVNQADDDGWTALVFAAERGHAATVHRLLRAGASAHDVIQDGWTALMLTCRGNHVEATRLLLRAGARVGCQQEDGWTPLMFACHVTDDIRIPFMLLQAKADVDQRTAQGETALMLACEKNHEHCARVLLDAGADVRIADPRHGRTALLLAAEHASAMLVRDLVQRRGAPVNGADARGKTPLMRAILHGRVDTSVALIELGADVHTRDGTGCSPLLLAAGVGHPTTIDHLLRASASPNVFNHRRYSPLMVAAEIGRLGVVRALLAAKADVEAAHPSPLFAPRARKVLCSHRRTPLALAAHGGYVLVVRALLAAGATIRVPATELSKDPVVVSAICLEKWRRSVRARPYALHWLEEYARTTFAPESEYMRYQRALWDADVVASENVYLRAENRLLRKRKYDDCASLAALVGHRLGVA